MKQAKNMYSLCSSSECEGCIYFQENEEKCLIGKLSETADHYIKDKLFVVYLHTLKNAYKKYRDNASKCFKADLKETAQYWVGMADSVYAFLRDFGFNHLVD